jgi:phosphoribosyl-AMP cyclohydrolase
MDGLKYDSKGLLTAVVQDIDNSNILMVAMMNAQALEMTLETKKVHFWSRSRKKLWLKGETSGNIMDVKRIMVDCDRDSLLVQVKPRGPACHTGNYTCFYTDLDDKNAI